MTFGHGTDAVPAERIVRAALNAPTTAATMNWRQWLGCAAAGRRREAAIATTVFNAIGLVGSE